MFTIALSIYSLSALVCLICITLMVRRDLSRGRAPLSLLVAVGCITLIICAIPVLNTVLAASFVADYINPGD